MRSFWALLGLKWPSVPEMTEISCFKKDTDREEGQGSAGQRGFIGQSFSRSLLRSRFCLTLISSATHVGRRTASPNGQTWASRIRWVSSILPPQDTAVAFDASRQTCSPRSSVHAWRRVCTRQKKKKKKGCVSSAKLFFRIGLTYWYTFHTFRVFLGKKKKKKKIRIY